MIIGAAGLTAGYLLYGPHRRLRADLEALSLRVNDLSQTSTRHDQALQDLQSAVSRIERSFTLLGERLSTQIEILEALQASQVDKEQKLQTALRAVIEAVNDLRQSRLTSSP